MNNIDKIFLRWLKKQHYRDTNESSDFYPDKPS